MMRSRSGTSSVLCMPPSSLDRRLTGMLSDLAAQSLSKGRLVSCLACMQAGCRLPIQTGEIRSYSRSTTCWGRRPHRQTCSMVRALKAWELHADGSKSALAMSEELSRRGVNLTFASST